MSYLSPTIEPSDRNIAVAMIVICIITALIVSSPWWGVYDTSAGGKVGIVLAGVVYFVVAVGVSMKKMGIIGSDSDEAVV